MKITEIYAAYHTVIMILFMIGGMALNMWHWIEVQGIVFGILLGLLTTITSIFCFLLGPIVCIIASMAFRFLPVIAIFLWLDNWIYPSTNNVIYIYGFYESLVFCSLATLFGIFNIYSAFKGLKHGNTFIGFS